MSGHLKQSRDQLSWCSCNILLHTSTIIDKVFRSQVATSSKDLVVLLLVPQIILLGVQGFAELRAGRDMSKTISKTILHVRELPTAVPPQEAGSKALNCLYQYHQVLISCGSNSEQILLKGAFSEGDEGELRWLLEDYPQTPFSLLRAKEATKALDWYARNLAIQVESSGVLQRVAVEGPIRSLEIRVEALEDEQNGKPNSLYAIHWETLEDLEAWNSPTFDFETVQVVRTVQPPSEALHRKV